jgi:hypothetical protein
MRAGPLRDDTRRTHARPHGFLFQHHSQFATDMNAFLDETMSRQAQ